MFALLRFIWNGVTNPLVATAIGMGVADKALSDGRYSRAAFEKASEAGSNLKDKATDALIEKVMGDETNPFFDFLGDNWGKMLVGGGGIGLATGAFSGKLKTFVLFSILAASAYAIYKYTTKDEFEAAATNRDSTTSQELDLGLDGPEAAYE